MMIMERKRKRKLSLKTSQYIVLTRADWSLERRRGLERGTGEILLKINFSVGVSMYSENVTSYWYRLRWSHRNRGAA